jgi:prevent-host-death family protein
MDERSEMGRVVNVHEAKTHLSKLLERVRQGEEIVIARSGEPVARLVAVTKRQERRWPGTAKGTLVYSDDFDAPLPDEVLDSFER